MTDKTLYRIDLTAIAWAHSKEDALDIIREDIFDVLNFDPSIYRVNAVPSLWYDSIPFGEEDDRTCGEILKEQKNA